MNWSAWVTCPDNWTLQDVQAGLNVSISILSLLAPFVFIQICWQRGAEQATKGIAVLLRSLLVVSNLGDVYDIFTFFRQSICSRKYVNVLVQCMTVIMFSTLAIFSGPVARFSSQQSQVVKQQTAPGLLAMGLHRVAPRYATERTKAIAPMLERASFPTDQLLDFLPDDASDWVYNPAEWNNSWILNCQNTEATTTQVETTDKNCHTGLWGIGGMEDYTRMSTSNMTAGAQQGFSGKSADGELMTYVWQLNYAVNGTAYFRNNSLMSIDLMSGRFGIPTSFTTSNYANTTDNNAYPTQCEYKPGYVTEYTFTKITCDLKRANNINDNQSTADPDIWFSGFPGFLDSCFDQFYSRWESDVISNSPMAPIPPHELIRFYQSWMITKDTFNNYPVSRKLSVRIKVVQVSVWFIIVTSTLTALIVLGLSSIAIFHVRHSKTTSQVPKSRLQWMMQSIEAEDRPCAASETGSRKSITVNMSAGWSKLPFLKRQQVEFEAASYGEHETSTWFLKSSSSSRDSKSSLEMHEDRDCV